jgi:hypothetical protein
MTTAFFVRDVALAYLDAQVDQVLRLARRAHRRTNLVACFDKLAREIPADEAGRACNEVFHLV